MVFTTSGKETGTLSCDSKSKEAGLFSISRSPTSAVDESQIELAVFADPSTKESIAHQQDETKPHPHPEPSCVVPIEEEVKPCPHLEPSVVVPTEEEVKPCPPPEPSVTVPNEEGVKPHPQVKPHPHPKQSIAVVAEKMDKPDCKTEVKGEAKPEEREVKPHPHPEQSTI